MRKKRYNYSPEEKVLILKRHLIGRGSRGVVNAITYLPGN